MTGPIRDELIPPDPQPDDYHDSDPPADTDPSTDEGPADSVLPSPERQPDLWDQEEGVPTDLEDIAIVCHEALRAYRVTQGSGSGAPWLNRTLEERQNMLELVARYAGKPPADEKLIGPPEALLVAHIVKALAR